MRPEVRVLLRDGALRVETTPELHPLVSSWLPLLPYADRATAPGGAVVRLIEGPAISPPDAPPVLRLGTVNAWVAGASLLLAGPDGCSGHARLDAASAELRVPSQADRGAAAWAVYSMASLACALLLGRMERTLAHAAAVVAPDGRAWLIVGDTHAGKSTTAANLLQGGWRFVSDDNGVLSRAAGGIEVEGWPRHFHMDEGWERGAPVGRRAAVDPHRRWPGRWLAAAPLAGLLFPRVEAALPTALELLAPADALAALVRQSPWLLADRAVAPRVLALLRDVAALPAYALRLGRDSYASPELLIERLLPAVEQP